MLVALFGPVLVLTEAGLQAVDNMLYEEADFLPDQAAMRAVPDQAAMEAVPDQAAMEAVTRRIRGSATTDGLGGDELDALLCLLESRAQDLERETHFTLRNVP